MTALETKLADVLRKVVEHVEDDHVQRVPPNSCTLCYTYRSMIHDALAEVAALEDLCR